MKRTLLASLVVAATLVAPSATTVAAQNVEIQDGIASLPPLPEGHPRQAVVAELMQRVLAGDRAGAEAHLRQHAAASFGADAQRAAVGALMELKESRGDGLAVRAIVASPTPTRVVIRMRSPQGPIPVIVDFEPNDSARVVALGVDP